MNSSNKNYQMTRREALCALATLPMITFGLGSPGRTVASPQLGKATEMDPGNECHAFLEFTRADLPLEVGYTYCYQGNQTKAMAFLETLVDPITLTVKEPTSERGRLDAIRMMALSTLKAKERDMEKSVYFWTAAMESARALQSEWGFNEALSIYELMELLWPQEPRLADLRSLIVHW
jgi:hypothetical protein